MPVVWPDSLVQELAERRAMIVLGAGASIGSVGNRGAHPPLWHELLENAINRLIMNVDTRREALDLLNGHKPLDSAEVLKSVANQADFGRYIREVFVRPRFKQSTIHELVLELDPKVLVTTNYDEIYDHYCIEGGAEEGYNVCKYYEDHALNDLRSPTRVVLKAHGCVSDPDKMILSRSEYFNARRLHPFFYNILDGLFLTNTVIFVGCSLEDPDLRLILENVNLSAASSHPHYALLEDGQPSSVVQSFRRSYNVELLQYQAGFHVQAEEALREFRDLVLEHRAKYIA